MEAGGGVTLHMGISGECMWNLGVSSGKMCLWVHPGRVELSVELRPVGDTHGLCQEGLPQWWGVCC